LLHNLPSRPHRQTHATDRSATKNPDLAWGYQNALWTMGTETIEQTTRAHGSLHACARSRPYPPGCADLGRHGRPLHSAPPNGCLREGALPPTEDHSITSSARIGRTGDTSGPDSIHPIWRSVSVSRARASSDQEASVPTATVMSFLRFTLPSPRMRCHGRRFIQSPRRRGQAALAVQ